MEVDIAWQKTTISYDSTILVDTYYRIFIFVCTMVNTLLYIFLYKFLPEICLILFIEIRLFSH